MDFTEFFNRNKVSFLRLIADGRLRSSKEIKEYLKAYIYSNGIITPSSFKSTLYSRIIDELRYCEYINYFGETYGDCGFRITEKGKKLISENDSNSMQNPIINADIKILENNKNYNKDNNTKIAKIPKEEIDTSLLYKNAEIENGILTKSFEAAILKDDGFRIPINCLNFFNITEIDKSESIKIEIEYKSDIYSASLFNNPNSRKRGISSTISLNWSKELTSQLKCYTSYKPNTVLVLLSKSFAEEGLYKLRIKFI